MSNTYPYFKDPYYTLTTQDGLQANEITSLTIDSSGIVWIGTIRGFCRWDGYKIYQYDHTPDGSSDHMSLFIRPNGLKYYQTQNKLLIGSEMGLSVLDLHTNEFTYYLSHDDDQSSINGEVLSIYIDSKEQIWLGTNRGITVLDSQWKVYKQYSIPSTLIEVEGVSLDRLNAVFDIMQDRLNPQIYWLATLEGLIKLDVSSDSMRLFRLPGDQYVKRMNEMTRLIGHPNGNLYICTWNYDFSIFSTMQEAFLTHIGPNAQDPKLKYPESITPLRVKSDEEIWVSSLQGLGILNTHTLEIRFIKSFSNEKGQRYHPLVFSISDEDIWIGSDFGLQNFRNKPMYIQNFVIEEKNELQVFLTNCLYEQRESQRLYIGYKVGKGLHYFDLDNNSFQVKPFNVRFKREKNVLKISQDLHSKKIYFITDDELYEYDDYSNLITGANLPHREIYSNTDFLILGDHNFLISDIYNGIRRFNYSTGKYENDLKWPGLDHPEGEQPYIMKIAQGGEDRIWYSRYGKSYGYYNLETGESKFFDQPGNRYDVKSFHFFNDTMWAGTVNNGLGYIDPLNPDDGIQIKYSIENGLSSNYIQDIQRDGLNRFWLLTSEGVECISSSMQKSFLLDGYHGLLEKDPTGKNAFTPGCLLMLSDGRMVIGYRNGLGFFKPTNINFEADTLVPYLYDIQILGKSILMQSNVSGEKVINLNHNQNYITLDYSVFNPNGHKDILLQHRLDGIDLDWVDYKEKVVTYPKLTPGKYLFNIRSIKTSGDHSHSQVSYLIHISPPWWNNPLAWSFYALSIISLVTFIYHYQLRRNILIKTAEHLQSLNELKTRLYTNITHEFRTPLTIIKGMSDQLKEKTGKALNHELEIINRNSDRLLYLVNDMLDLQKIEANRMITHMIQDDIIPFLAYVVHSFWDLAKNKNIELRFHSHIPSLLMDYDAEKYQNILSNLITNAIKFTPEKGKILVESFYEEEDQGVLVVSISDSGIGIPESSLPFIFDRFYQVDDPSINHSGGTGIGLSLTKELVKLLNGKIEVESSPGLGTTFQLHFPVTNDFPLQETIYSTTHSGVEKSSHAQSNGNFEITGTKNNSPIVLIVEDNPDMMEYLRLCLMKGYHIISSFDGNEGMQNALRVIPDAIISDVMMPGMNGIELSKKLKQDFRTSHIPIILLTAKADQYSKLSGLESGADAYMTKPFHKEELLLRIKKLIESRNKLRERYSTDNLPTSSSETYQHEDKFILEIRNLINEHLGDENFNISKLCKSLSMSRAQLYRKFEALTDIPIGKYIRMKRLYHAKHLLSDTDANVTEAAMESGFRNLSHFSTAFKEEFGVTPSEIKG